MRSFDWIARTAMLVLAGLVSLSIIGAIAAIPSGTIESRIGMEQGAEPVRDATQPTSPQPERQAQEGISASDAGGAAGTEAVSPPDQRRNPALWLEAITYALLALVGLAALAALLLWQGVRERRRMAAALEMIAARWS